MLDIGLVGTEMVYFAVGELGLDGGVMVTASHNPKDYTGMKIVRAGALPVGGDSGLLDVRDRAIGIGTGIGRGRRPVASAAVRHLAGVRRARAVVRRRGRAPAAEGRDRRGERDGRDDAAAGARASADRGRRAATSSPTGAFRTTSRTRCCPRTASSSSAKTLEEGADFGVAFDGDADRCFFVDDTGEFVAGDFATALFAQGVLEKEPGAKVIYDVRASWAVPETIEAAGGVPVVNRVGHAFIKLRMREVDAAFAGEVSGHYYFRDFSQADSGVVPFLLMLERISKGAAKLSELLRPFRERYFITGEINTPVADVPAKLAELEERFGPEGDGLAPRRALGRGGGLALQRAALEHRAAAAPEPRGALAGADGAQARRGARGRSMSPRPPFKFSASTRVGFSDTDAQGIVYYGRYMPYFDLARVEYHRALDMLRTEPRGRASSSMRACTSSTSRRRGSTTRSRSTSGSRGSARPASPTSSPPTSRARRWR